MDAHIKAACRTAADNHAIAGRIWKHTTTSTNDQKKHTITDGMSSREEIPPGHVPWKPLDIYATVAKPVGSWTWFGSIRCAMKGGQSCDRKMYGKPNSLKIDKKLAVK